MIDVVGPDTVLGYCTNVHAGATFDTMLDNLKRFTPRVKEHASPDRAMGVGLWLSRQSAYESLHKERIGELSDFLNSHQLMPYTLNGFPYGNFHDTVVKHRVYEPDWLTEERLTYTLDLAAVLHRLMSEWEQAHSSPLREGSISTLPIGWRGDRPWPDDRMRQAAKMLVRLVDGLEDFHHRTGRLIHVDLEPEPGCVFDRSSDVVQFFEHHLDIVGKPEHSRRYLRVCHDTCHAAVMFEPQREFVARLVNAGIAIGKVQISSAIRAPFDRVGVGGGAALLDVMKTFDEDRFLHQTTVADAVGTAVEGFYDDLPGALSQARVDRAWRVHFHVPLFVEGFRQLETTQDEVLDTLALARGPLAGCSHYEVETYAWGVLPEALRNTDLSSGIARELIWVKEQVMNNGDQD
ncbi:MAG: hypothetical protein GC164_01510 [Phycisphaera sp.]|nr:hypothetical protein [Phycisphaera sp.]